MGSWGGGPVYHPYIATTAIVLTTALLPLQTQSNFVFCVFAYMDHVIMTYSIITIHSCHINDLCNDCGGICDFKAVT